MPATVTYSLQVAQSDEFQANTYESGDQLAPDALGLSNGGYVVAYNNWEVSDGFIVLDFYNADGASVGGYSIPYTPPTGAVGAPTLAQLSNGNVLVVWEDNDAAHHGLLGTILDESGNVVVPQFTLSAFGEDAAPQVAALAGGGFVVACTRGTSDIVFEVFDENGESVGLETPISGTGSSVSEPVITALADGGFVVTWTNSTPPRTGSSPASSTRTARRAR